MDGQSLATAAEKNHRHHEEHRWVPLLPVWGRIRRLRVSWLRGCRLDAYVVSLGCFISTLVPKDWYINYPVRTP